MNFIDTESVNKSHSMFYHHGRMEPSCSLFARGNEWKSLTLHLDKHGTKLKAHSFVYKVWHKQACTEAVLKEVVINKSYLM